jgi:hypothetical protein
VLMGDDGSDTIIGEGGVDYLYDCDQDKSDSDYDELYGGMGDNDFLYLGIPLSGWDLADGGGDAGDVYVRRFPS